MRTNRVPRVALPLIAAVVLLGSENARASDARRSAPWTRGIVMDLDRNGIHTVQRGGSSTVGGAALALETAWIAFGDALLVRDRDRDGCLAHAPELFGGSSDRSGFDTLATLDENRDGEIDAGDAQWPTLRAWRDDGDARCEPGELLTMAEAGVTTIDVRTSAWNERDGAGSVLHRWAVFEHADGRESLAVEVIFAPAQRRAGDGHGARAPVE